MIVLQFYSQWQLYGFMPTYLPWVGIMMGLHQGPKQAAELIMLDLLMVIHGEYFYLPHPSSLSTILGPTIPLEILYISFCGPKAGLKNISFCWSLTFK